MGIYVWTGLAVFRAGRPVAARASGGVARTRNTGRSLYRAVTLFAGNIFLDEIGMLEAHELDRKAILDVTHHAALGLAHSNNHTDRWPQVGSDSDCCARLRKVDNPAGDIGAIWQD